MAILLVNGVEVASPSEMRVSVYDVASAADRNAKGDVVIDRVAVKRKLELKWAHLSAAQMSALLAAVGDEAFFQATYPDPATGAARMMTCYAGERAAAVLRVEDGQPVWKDLTMEWIER